MRRSINNRSHFGYYLLLMVLLTQAAATLCALGQDFQKVDFVGKTVYQGKPLQSSYWISSPQSSADGLLFYFHGDGGSQGVRTQLGRLISVAQKNNLVLAGAATPIGNSWYGVIEPKTPKDPFPTAQFFDELIQSIFQRHRINRDRVYLTGISGGAVFITGRYLPVYGRDYKGGAVLLCGGSPSDTYEQGFEIYRNPKEFMAYFPLYFYAMKGDYLYQQILEGVASYRAAGFSVSSEFPSGGSHCGFSQEEQLGRGLETLTRQKGRAEKQTFRPLK